jgi:hypothetical protein
VKILCPECGKAADCGRFMEKGQRRKLYGGRVIVPIVHLDCHKVWYAPALMWRTVKAA